MIFCFLYAFEKLLHFFLQCLCTETLINYDQVILSTDEKNWSLIDRSQRDNNKNNDKNKRSDNNNNRDNNINNSGTIIVNNDECGESSWDLST